MKIGSAVWNFTHPHYNPPYEEAIKTVGSLGVDGIEMIAYTDEDLHNYYNDQHCKELKGMINEYGMEVSEFVLYAYAAVGLLAPEEKEREKALDYFRRGIEVAKILGSDTVNIVSNWPDEFKCPVDYLPYYIHPIMCGLHVNNNKQHIDIPDNFDATATWNRYLDSLAKIVKMCEENNVRFALEGHANVIVGTTDAMLRAFDWIKSDAFGTNFDTAWQLIQREYLPWSILKLGKKIFHVHMRDGDGLALYQKAVGQGIIDWPEVVRALKKVGFDGYLSLELGGFETDELRVRNAKESIDYIKNILITEGVYTGR